MDAFGELPPSSSPGGGHCPVHSAPFSKELPSTKQWPPGDKGTKDEYKEQKTCQKLSQGGTKFGEIGGLRPTLHPHHGVRLQLNMSHILTWFLFLPVLLPPPPVPLEQWLSMPGPRSTSASPGHCQICKSQAPLETF